MLNNLLIAARKSAFSWCVCCCGIISSTVLKISVSGVNLSAGEGVEFAGGGEGGALKEDLVVAVDVVLDTHLCNSVSIQYTSCAALPRAYLWNEDLIPH